MLESRQGFAYLKKNIIKKTTNFDYFQNIKRKKEWVVFLGKFWWTIGDNLEIWSGLIIFKKSFKLSLVFVSFICFDIHICMWKVKIFLFCHM